MGYAGSVTRLVEEGLEPVQIPLEHEKVWGFLQKRATSDPLLAAHLDAAFWEASTEAVSGELGKKVDELEAAMERIRELQAELEE